MDSLAALGNGVGTTLAPTVKLYRGLLLKNATAIRSSHRQEHAYGSHPRQKLDVYHAHDLTASTNGSAPRPSTPIGPDTAFPAPPPILVFFYGGGFIKGAKRFNNSPEDLNCRNVGHFFASRGFTTIIADYRLATPKAYTGAKFPDGGHDVSAVVEWIRTHLTDADCKRDIFLMATSAGAAHLATFMLHPLFMESRNLVSPNNGAASLRLRGVTYISGFLDMNPEHVKGVPGVPAYYGPDSKDWQANGPVGLLKQMAVRRRSRSLRLAFRYAFHDPPPPARTPTLALISSFDPDAIVLANDDFAAAWDESKLGPLERATIGGHNHFSSLMGLGTGVGQEEKWGFAVMGWMRDLCNHSTQRRISVQMPLKDETMVTVTMEDLSTGYSKMGY